jgi:hypothetical protein
MPMYPPSDEAEDIRIARNKAQGHYAVLTIQVLLGLLTGMFRHFDALSVIWLGGGLLGLLRLVLVNRGVSRTRQLCSLVVGFAIVGTVVFLRK